MSEHVVVVGGGMVAHRFVEALRSRDTGSAFSVTVLAEEARAPYDRVGLSAFFSGSTPEELALGHAGALGRPAGDPAHRSARGGRRPGRAVGHDRRRRGGRLRPPRAGHRVVRLGAAGAAAPTSPGCSSTAPSTTSSPCASWVRRREAELGRPVRGAVVGGGLLGLEAAGALVGLGAALHRRGVRAAADGAAGRRGRRRGAAPDHRGDGRRRAPRHGIGVDRRRRRRPRGRAAAGRRRRMPLPVDVVVFATGVRPRDELAGPAGLPIGAARRRGRRRGVPHRGPAGLGGRRGRLRSRAAAWAWSRRATRWPRSSSTGCSAATRPSRAPTCRPSSSCSASTSPRSATPSRRRPGALELVYVRPRRRGLHEARRHRRRPHAARRGARRRRVGLRLAAPDGRCRARRRPGAVAAARGRGRRAPADRAAGRRRRSARATTSTAGAIRDAVTEHGCHDVAAVKALHAGRHVVRVVHPAREEGDGRRDGQGGRHPVERDVRARRAVAGRAVRRRAGQRAAHLQRDHRALRHAGAAATSASRSSRRSSPRSTTSTCSPPTGPRCRTPTTGSWPTCRRTAPTRSCRGCPAARSCPSSSCSSAQVAQDFGLYTKITGGQRIDLFGARLEQLPAIWAPARRRRDGVGARLRQGAAHREVVRRVVVVPLRRAGLGRAWRCCSSCATAACAARTSSSWASPAAPASAPRPAARTSALIATEKGWNVYVGGNGGFTPRHAELLVEDVDDDDRDRDHRPLPHATTCAPPTGCSAPRPGSRSTRVASTGSARSSSTTPSASRPTSRRTWPGTSTTTRTSGPPCCATPSGCASSPPSSTPPTSPTRPSPTSASAASAAPRRGRARRRRHGIRTRPHRPDHPGGSLMTAVADRLTRVDICSLDQLTPELGVAALVGGEQVAVFRLADDRVFAVSNLCPFSGAAVISRGITGSRGERADHRVARLQAGLLPRRRALPGCRWTRFRCPVVDPTWRCTP